MQSRQWYLCCRTSSWIWHSPRDQRCATPPILCSSRDRMSIEYMQKSNLFSFIPKLPLMTQI